MTEEVSPLPHQQNEVLEGQRQPSNSNFAFDHMPNNELLHCIGVGSKSDV